MREHAAIEGGCKQIIMTTSNEPLGNPIFIVGAQRSGTTLLRLILNAHSRIAISREAVFLMPLLKKRSLENHISGDSLKKLIGFFGDNFKYNINYEHYDDLLSTLYVKERLTIRELMDGLFSSYCHAEGKIIRGNKTPSFFRKIDILYELFPDALFIHIVRDGRDVFDSWRKKREMPKNEEAGIAIDWIFKLFRIERSFKKIPIKNKITIRYEDLLVNPEETMQLVCSKVGVEYEATMFDFYKTSSSQTGEHHSKLIFSPINKKNKYKWKENLTAREVKIFNMLAGHYLRKYNYEVENERFTLPDALFLLKDILIGLPRRLIQVLRVKIFFNKATLKAKS